MDVTLAVLADAANRTDNGKLNILGIFSTLYASQTPCHHPIMSLVLSFQASAFERGSQQQVGIKLVDADGQTVLAPPDSMLQVPAADGELTPGLNLIANLTNVKFDAFGSYQFEIFVNGQRMAQIPLTVIRTS